MTVRSVLASLLALALGAACAVLVACGGDGDDAALIPPARADELLRELDRLERSVRTGDCESVGGDAARLQQAVGALPARVDAQLRRRLADGAANLADIAPEECDERARTTDTANTTETVPTQTVETTTATVPTQTTETQPPRTTEPEPPRTQAPPPQTNPPVEPIPDSGGGATAPPSDGAGSGGSDGGAGTGGATPTP